jgi:hypothetical protein
MVEIAQQMVERPVLHHQDNDVLDAIVHDDHPSSLVSERIAKRLAGAVAFYFARR